MERGEVLRSVVGRSDAIERARHLSGIFSLDGQDFEVENNIWSWATTTEVVVVDAAHDPGRSSTPWATGRAWPSSPPTVTTTTSMPPASWPTRSSAPIWLHPGRPDAVGRRLPRPRRPTATWPTAGLLTVGRRRRSRSSTPRATRPAAVCLYDAETACLFSGDTLFHGGPGRHRAAASRTSRPSSSRSVTACWSCPPATRVLTGPRRRHHHRGRGPAPPGVDRPGPLSDRSLGVTWNTQ